MVIKAPNCVRLPELPVVPYQEFYSCHILIVATHMIQHDMWHDLA